MLSGSAMIQLEKKDGKLCVRLPSESEKYYECAIHNIPADSIVIQADKNFPPPKSLFRGSKKECKRADFIIISEEEKAIVCIELKGGNNSLHEDIAAQLKGAACLAAYIKEIGNLFWDKESFLQKYTCWFVGIVNLSKKRPFRKLSEEGRHNTPKKFLRISSPKHIFFKQLAPKNRIHPNSTL